MKNYRRGLHRHSPFISGRVPIEIRFAGIVIVKSAANAINNLINMGTIDGNVRISDLHLHFTQIFTHFVININAVYRHGLNFNINHTFPKPFIALFWMLSGDETENAVAIFLLEVIDDSLNHIKSPVIPNRNVGSK